MLNHVMMPSDCVRIGGPGRRGGDLHGARQRVCGSYHLNKHNLSIGARQLTIERERAGQMDIISRVLVKSVLVNT